MGIMVSIYEGWFGKRRELPDSHDDKTFVVPESNDSAGAHSAHPNANFAVTTPPRQQIWDENDHYRSPDPTTHDAPQHHDQKEEDNGLVVSLYRSSPEAQMERRELADDSRWRGGGTDRQVGVQSTARVIYPFDQGMKRTFNGNHFSMADHQRTYPVGGLAPAIPRRNTYRIDPVPHDLNIVDKPYGGRTPVRDTQYVDRENPPPYGFSYRLG